MGNVRLRDHGDAAVVLLYWRIGVQRSGTAQEADDLSFVRRPLYSDGNRDNDVVFWSAVQRGGNKLASDSGRELGIGPCS